MERNEPQLNDKSEESPKTFTATWALCFAMFCHTYLLISPFTYSGFMAIHLIPDLTAETAGSFAGLISASYMLGRSITSFAWGTVADTIGRKPVFYVSFIVPTFMSIWFGCANSIYVALFTRFSMGMANGIVVAAKTSVSELARGDEKFESKSMGLVMGMWGWGFLICPPISGALSEPVKQYPNSQVVQYFEPLLSKYPFLLPNLVSVIICIAGFVSIYLFVDETLPEEKIRTIGSVAEEFFENIKMRANIRSIFYRDGSNEEFTPLQGKDSSTDLYCSSEKSYETCTVSNTDDSSGTTEQESEFGMPRTESCTLLSTSVGLDSTKSIALEENEVKKPVNRKKHTSKTTMSSLWAVDSTRHHLIARWNLVFPSMVFDEAFPLFCIAVNGGLSLNETGIGKILSGAGLIFVFGQYYTYTFIVSRYGLFNSQIIGSICATPLCFFTPFALYLNRGAQDFNTVTWPCYIFLSLLIGFSNIGGNVVLCSLTMTTNRTVTSDQRASMNGLSMLGGSLVKAFGPAIAGYLVSFLLGSGLVPSPFGTIILFGLIGSFGLYCVFYVSVYLRRYNDGDYSILKSGKS